MIEEGIFKLLTQDRRFANLASTRCYPLNLPETATMPAATYREISAVDDWTLDGPLGRTTARLQIDAWGTTYAQATKLARAIYLILNGYEGELPNGVEVQLLSRENSESGFDEGPRLFYKQADYKVSFADPDEDTDGDQV